MKLDVKAMRYLTPEDWRVLTAVSVSSSSSAALPSSFLCFPLFEAC